MTKRNVICPICKNDLGRFHDNASAKPLRNHIFESHKKEWEEILSTVEEIRGNQDYLKKEYDIGYWDMVYYHRGTAAEIEFNNRPPLTEDQVKRLQKNILRLK